MKKYLLAMLLFCLPAHAANQQSFGDSTTYCSIGPSSQANCYTSLLAAATGRTLVNNAINGTLSGDMAVKVENTTFAPTDLVTFLIGVNDTQRYFTAEQQTYYYRFIMGAALKVLAPNRLYPALDLVGTVNPAMMQTGTWYTRNPDSRMTWPTKGVLSNVAGSTITGVVSGTTVYVGTTIHDYLGAGVPGLAEVWIDGVLAGTYTSNGNINGSVCTAQRCEAPGVFRFAGLTAGSHSVQIKLISGFVYFEYLIGNANQPAAPSLYIGTPTRTYQAADTQGPAVAIILGQKVTDAVNQLVADGFNAHKVDIYPLITQAYVIADNIHINDAGNVLMKNAYLAAQGPPPPPPTQFPAFPFWNGTNYILYSDSAGTLNPHAVP